MIVGVPVVVVLFTFDEGGFGCLGEGATEEGGFVVVVLVGAGLVVPDVGGVH